MSSKRNRKRNALDFFNPRWADAVGGTAAALWTRRDGVWFRGPYERVADLFLWTVRDAGGRPVLSCYAPLADRSTGVVRVGPERLRGVWDLGAGRGEPGALVGSADGLACEVADLLVRQWPASGVCPPPVPATFVGYGHRLPVVRTPEFAARLAESHGDDPTPDQFRACWEGVPRFVKTAERENLYLYPSRFVCPDGPAPFAFHPITMEPAPSEDAEAAPGWAKLGGRWVPTLPPGGGEVYASTAALAGVETANPAVAVLKEHGILDRKVGAADEAAIAAAVERLRDQDEFLPKDRLLLCEAVRSRMSRRVKYTLEDLMAALLNPLRPIRSSVQPRVAAFPASDLEGLAARGWDLDLTAEGPRRGDAGDGSEFEAEVEAAEAVTA